MRLISCHHGKLLTLDAQGIGAAPGSAVRRGFVTGLAELDALAPGGAFARGAVHELLADPDQGRPLFLAMLLARAACCGGVAPGGMLKDQSAAVEHNPRPARAADSTSSIPSWAIPAAILWCDPAGELYPPALAACGVPLDRLFLLRPPAAATKKTLGERELIWAAAEALACRGVGAVVAPLGRLSRIEARRLQLAAERGGGVALLLRPTGRAAGTHAAATRWLVRPAPGERTMQRWEIQLIHGHGGRCGQTLCLEHCRETNHLRTSDPLADRPAAPHTTERAAGVA